MNLGLRYEIETLADSLKVGQAVRYDRHKIADAYPPMGMDYIRALVIEENGNRPEPVMTTEDQVRQFCARQGLVLFFNPLDGSVTFRPMTIRCTTCCGSGKVQQLERTPRKISSLFSSVATINFKIADCETCGGLGQIRAPGDPYARFGDHSASDAWIARRRSLLESTRTDPQERDQST